MAQLTLRQGDLLICFHGPLKAELSLAKEGETRKIVRRNVGRWPLAVSSPRRMAREETAQIRSCRAGGFAVLASWSWPSETEWRALSSPSRLTANLRKRENLQKCEIRNGCCVRLLSLW